MRLFIFIFLFAITSFSQMPPIEPGVSEELAKWRAAHYSDIRYKLNLTLEKGAPMMKGEIEIRVTLDNEGASPDLILDWRQKEGYVDVWQINEVKVDVVGSAQRIVNDHLLIPTQYLKTGENVVKINFTTPIKTSGSAITSYIDKEDGSEYIYSLFVPSDASTAFPVVDQPDLKARFSLEVNAPGDWKVVSNTNGTMLYKAIGGNGKRSHDLSDRQIVTTYTFAETIPISTYVFAFAAGPWVDFDSIGSADQRAESTDINKRPLKDLANNVIAQLDAQQNKTTHVYVRKSQAEKFKPHAAEVFRLNREAVKYLETYFDYKFPWPKYDLVLIPEFPFGGMEHAGATFLREDRIIFPAEPTANDYITRANLIFHEAAHQWFGDLVTMRWFDDLWLKEGFAEFMAYKTLEKVMPEYNAWKAFYERNKQAAYATDSTKGTTAIYQPIKNLSSAKSAYGNIVYRKAPSFLRQAEFYLGEDKFQTAARAFLKKHEFRNAGWEDLVKEFETASGRELREWANVWVTRRGNQKITNYKNIRTIDNDYIVLLSQAGLIEDIIRPVVFNLLIVSNGNQREIIRVEFDGKEVGKVVSSNRGSSEHIKRDLEFVFPNYQDYGYGIFLLDDKSRNYVLKNIQNEKDPFLRSMMWGSLWDSVREAELDPREYVELVVKQLGGQSVRSPRVSKGADGSSRAPSLTVGLRTPATDDPSETDETTIQSLLGRVSIALNYYLSTDAVSEPPASVGGTNAVVNPTSQTTGLRSTRQAPLPPAHAGGSDSLRARFEDLLLDRLQNASTAGQRVTYFRAFVNNASTERSRRALKQMLEERPASAGVSSPHVSKGADGSPRAPSLTVGLRTKDKFDVVTRLVVLGDSDAAKLLADLEKKETSDDAKRYAYAAHAAFGTAENKAKFFNDFVSNKDISESWIESAIVPFNSIRHADLTQQYLTRALAELPNLKRTRKIFFIGNWLSAFIGGQRDEKALSIINKFLADNPNLDNDLRLKILENSDLIERAIKIRAKYKN